MTKEIQEKLLVAGGISLAIWWLIYIFSFQVQANRCEPLEKPLPKAVFI